MGERRKVAAIFVLKIHGKIASYLYTHVERVIHTYALCINIYIYICVPMYSVLYVSLIYMYMWDIQNYAFSSLYSCIFIILYGEIISIILKDTYTIQKHFTFPRTEPGGFGIFESPSGHVSHLRAQFTTKEPCCSTLPQYTRLRLIIKVARPNPFPNMMEVILKCRSSMHLELKLLSMQQIWDFKGPSTELTFSMEHGPHVNAFLIGRMGGIQPAIFI